MKMLKDVVKIKPHVKNKDKKYNDENLTTVKINSGDSELLNRLSLLLQVNLFPKVCSQVFFDTENRKFYQYITFNNNSLKSKLTEETTIDN